MVSKSAVFTVSYRFDQAFLLKIIKLIDIFFQG